MKAFKGLAAACAAAACAGWLAACFTEVGNAEDDRLVEAKFNIDYSDNPAPKRATVPLVPLDPDSVQILRFYLNVEEAEFHLADSAGRHSEFHLWRSDTSTLPVDFTGKDSAAVLPSQTVTNLNPQEFLLKCVVPMRDTLSPDTMSFDAFSDRGYIKGLFGPAQNPVAFLFALPTTRELVLEYPPAAIDGWYSKQIYHCKFTFYGTKWLSGSGLTAASKWKDRSGKSVAILDPNHNASLYAALVQRFYASFNAGQVTHMP